MKKIYILCLIAIYCFILKYMFHVFLPFILAVLCFFIIKPIIDFLEKRFHIQRSAIGISLLLCFYLILAFLLGIIVTYAIIYCVNWIKEIPDIYQNTIVPLFRQIVLYFKNHYPILMNQDYLQIMNDYSQKYIIYFMNYASYFITLIPQFFMSFFLFVISSFFLVIEYDQIKEKILSVCSSSFIHSFIYIKNQFLKSLKIYMKCQFILMIICFLILLIGFMVLRMEHSLLLALITAFFDSLPFIGVGIVLIPLIIIFLINKMYLKAFYILLLYLIINVIRSFLEPHIMNKQTKVPSFILLLSMMIHFYFFGIIGIILSPVHVSLIYSLCDYYSS